VRGAARDEPEPQAPCPLSSSRSIADITMPGAAPKAAHVGSPARAGPAPRASARVPLAPFLFRGDRIAGSLSVGDDAPELRRRRGAARQCGALVPCACNRHAPRCLYGKLNTRFRPLRVQGITSGVSIGPVIFFAPCACGKDQGSPRELELPPGPHPGLLPFALKPHGNHVLSTWGRISFEGQRNLNVLPGHLRVGAIEWRSREIGPRLYCQFEIRAQKPCVQACGTSQGDYPGKVSGEKCILGARQSRCNLTNEPRLTP